jgi:ferrous iron transport protein B
MLGVFLITLAEMTGLIDLITKIFRFPVHIMMGLPEETASVITLGFLRKDVSIALLQPFGMSAKQLVIACIFMAMYLPCTASFFVLLKEGGWKDTAKIIALTLCVSLLTGTVLNIIL